MLKKNLRKYYFDIFLNKKYFTYIRLYLMQQKALTANR
jgi:hypothetical protein